jgi:hypothetical protein
MSRRKLYILLCGLSLAGYVWIGWNLADGTGSEATPEVCLFKAVTHIPCPSCGATRALVLLANGDVVRSIMENPIGVLLALGLIVIPGWVVVDVVRKRDSLLRWYAKGERLLSGNKWIAVPAVALVVLNWVWNITKGL